MGEVTEQKPAIVKAGVGVILCKGRQILVGKRIGGHGDGCYAFPGGHLEHSDALKWNPLGGLGFCAEREVEEETGIICRVFSPDRFRQDLFTTFDILSPEGDKVYITAYLVAEHLHGGKECTLGGGKTGVEGREPDKCARWEWVTLDDLVKLVSTDKEKVWIPLPQVLYYLKQLWKERT